MKYLIGIWTILASALNLLGIAEISWFVVFCPLAIYLIFIFVIVFFTLLTVIFLSK